MISSIKFSRLAQFILAIALLTTSFATIAQSAFADEVVFQNAQADTCGGSFVINSSQEVPSNSSTASGTGVYNYDPASGVLNWSINFSGVTATAAHFHGPAAAGSNAGVQINVGAISGLSSPLMGSTTLTSAQASDLIAGLWYLNIHSDAFPGGEIRGQLPDCQTTASTCSGDFAINSAQEVPTNNSTASGTGTYNYDSATNVLSWSISFSGITATAMHFHGPAMPGSNAGVEVNVGAISGLSTPSMGSTTLTAAQADDLLNGLWYLNIHSDAFPGGEIRGQLPACQPLAVDMVQTQALVVSSPVILLALSGVFLSLTTLMMITKRDN